VLVFVDGVAGGQRRPGVGPVQGRDVEEGLDLAGEHGQHRLQVAGQVAEQGQGGGADDVQLAVAAFLLGHLPGLLLGDVQVGDVGQRMISRRARP
jgi:hypothetical protein